MGSLQWIKCLRLIKTVGSSRLGLHEAPVFRSTNEMKFVIRPIDFSVSTDNYDSRTFKMSVVLHLHFQLQIFEDTYCRFVVLYTDIKVTSTILPRCSSKYLDARSLIPSQLGRRQESNSQLRMSHHRQCSRCGERTIIVRKINNNLEVYRLSWCLFIT